MTAIATEPRQAVATIPRRSVTNGLVYLSAFTSSWTAVALGSYNVVDYLLAASVVVMLLARLTRGRRIFIDLWMVLPTVAALIVTAVAAIIGGDASGETESLVRIIVSTAIVAILLTSLGVESGRVALRRALAWWAAGVSVNSLASGAVTLGLVNFTGVLVQPTGYRLSGLSSHPNSIAFSIAMAAPVLIYLLTTTTGARRVLWWLLNIAVCGWGLFLADSRSGLLMTIPAMGLALVLALAHSRLKLLILPLLIFGGTAVVLLLPGALAETRLVQGAADSDSGRLLFNDDALTVFLRDPIFGGGFNEQAGVAVPLMVLSAGGILLLVGYYAFVLRPVPLLWRSKADRIAQTGILSVVVFIGFGFLNPVFAERATFWPAIIAALSALLVLPSISDRSPWRQRHPNTRP